MKKLTKIVHVYLCLFMIFILLFFFIKKKDSYKSRKKIKVNENNTITVRQTDRQTGRHTKINMVLIMTKVIPKTLMLVSRTMMMPIGMILMKLQRYILKNKHTRVEYLIDNGKHTRVDDD